MGSRIINTNDYISREEMLELIEALTLDEMRQLGKIASYYGTWVNGWTAGDILNEALLRAIRYDNGPDKRRRCKKGNNILRFFASAMRRKERCKLRNTYSSIYRWCRGYN